MLVGYARVSTAEQSLALQQDALEKAGCGRTFTDVVSGAVKDRAGLAAALDYVRAGDTRVPQLGSGRIGGPVLRRHISPRTYDRDECCRTPGGRPHRPVGRAGHAPNRARQGGRRKLR